MKKIIVTLFIVLGTAWFLFGQCPTVDYFATDGPGFIQLSSPQSNPCIESFCERRAGTASIEFSDLPDFELVLVAPFPVSVVWHKASCDSILLTQCVPLRVSGDTMVFGTNFAGYRIATIFSDTIAEIWSVVQPSTTLPYPTYSFCNFQSLVALQAPKTRETEGVLTSITGVPVGNNPPAGIYLEVYPDEAGKKPRLVRVLR
jgi:hypothetical protein